MVINRIGPMSCAKIVGTLYALLGLCAGAVFSLIGMAGAFGSDSPAAGVLSAFFGVGAIVALPLMYGAIGFVTTLIGAWLYNMLAGAVGGIELDVR
jgi:hypothetical protein